MEVSEIYVKMKLDKLQTIPLTFLKRARACLIFPNKIIAIRPIPNSIELKNFIVDNNVIKCDSVIKIEFIENYLFVENLLTTCPEKILSLYVAFEGGVQTFLLHDSGHLATDKAMIIEFS